MFAEIIATGDEIRTGTLVDSNSAHIAQMLEENSLEILRHHTVGDDIRQLVELLQEVGKRADVAIVTGGLGPTMDDLSAQAAADAAGVGLEMNPLALTIVERFFKKLNRSMSPSNRKQALVPVGAVVLDNPVGTAPGFLLTIGACRFFFLPGVPYEMKRMLKDEVLPEIRRVMGDERSYSLSRTICCFGLPESLVGEKMADLTTRFPQFKLGLRAKFPEIQIKLYARGEDKNTLEKQFQTAVRWIKAQLGSHIFSENGSTMAAVVGDLLRSKRATVAVAESCTGGLISHMLTNVPNSSDYLILSAVTYANSAKINVLGVDADIIKGHGAVSKATVVAMAQGVRDVAGATYGIAVSGIAGPGGGTPDKPVGTICLALSGPEQTLTDRHLFSFGRRRMLKSIFAMASLDMLRKHLEASS